MNSLDVLPDRFVDKVCFEPNTGCWLWTGGTNQGGYGRVRIGGRKGRKVVVHRYVYEALVGPIPDRLTLDHLCRVRQCVNPSHLEPVTHRVNVLRGIGGAAQNARKTRCHQGHPFDEANTSRDWKGGRHCRACAATRDQGRTRSRR